MADADPGLQLVPVRHHRQLALRWLIVSGVLLSIQIAVGLAFGPFSAPLHVVQGAWLFAAACAHGHWTEARGYLKGLSAHG